MRRNILTSALALIVIILLASTLFSEVKKEEDYTGMMKEVNKLFSAKKYDKAAELLEASIDKYPGKEYRILHNLTMISWRQNNFEKMMKYYEMGHKKGFYFGIWLDAEPWKTNYENNKRFQKIVAKNNELLTKANIDSTPVHKIVTPGGFVEGKKYPVIIFLHGWNENFDFHIKNWNSKIINEKFLACYLRSSQVIGWNGYGWTNVDQAMKDIKDFYADIKSKYAVDENIVIIAGFSQGGKTAVEAALKQVISITGFIALAPGGGIPDWRVWDA